MGFMVVRPIPGYAIGRTCLRTYPERGSNVTRSFPITLECKANFNGIDFSGGEVGRNLGVGTKTPTAARELLLLLDSEALSAVAHGLPLRRDRVRALIAEMRRRELPVATVAAALAEVVRGRAADAAVFGGLRRERVQVRPVDTRVGVRAGQLLGSARKGSELAVDAFLVAVADLEGGALIATTDATHLKLLASHADFVAIADVRA